MINILTFLPIKSNKSQVDKTKLNLPPIYDIFLNTYDVDKMKYKFLVKFMNPYCVIDTFGSFQFNFNEKFSNLEWTGFLNYKDMINSQLTIDYIIEESKIELLYIGELAYQPICLGINGDNIDKIFFPGDNIYEDGLIKLADNIFEFCVKFTFMIDPLQNINPSNLYKNWNADFWRIKSPEFRDAGPYELLYKDSLDKRYNEPKKSSADLS